MRKRLKKKKLAELQREVNKVTCDVLGEVSPAIKKALSSAISTGQGMYRLEYRI